MPLCTYSNDYDAKNYTLLENKFITDYLPIMTDDDIKVYVFGLYLCNNAYGEDNNLNGFCLGTGMKANEVKKSFENLQNLGLITVIATQPLAVRFNSPSKALPQNRTFNRDKYSDFCTNIEQLYPTDALTQNDLFAFIDFVEDTKIDQDAFVMITRYCIDLVGKKVKRNYILTVARSWVEDGIKTVGDVEKRLIQVDSVTGEIKQVLRALRSKREPDLDDRELYLKWLRLGFSLDAVLVACKGIKRGGMISLDDTLEDFATRQVFTAEDIKAFASRKETIENCTAKILQNLGLRYQDTTAISDENIAPLFQKGFSSEGLTKISRYCRIIGVRELSGFEKTVEDFYKGGYISDHSIDLQLDALTKFDENVQNLIYATGSTRKITPQDRDLYRTWTVTWGIDEQIILKFARESQGKAYAMSWLGSRLSTYRESNEFSMSAVSSPTAEATKKTGGLSDFEKAEIREKLMEDAIYSSLLGKKKKLDFEMSDYIFSDKTVPVTMQKQLEDLQKQMDERITELGYKTEDLK